MRVKRYIRNPLQRNHSASRRADLAVLRLAAPACCTLSLPRLPFPWILCGQCGRGLSSPGISRGSELVLFCFLDRQKPAANAEPVGGWHILERRIAAKGVVGCVTALAQHQLLWLVLPRHLACLATVVIQRIQRGRAVDPLREKSVKYFLQAPRVMPDVRLPAVVRDPIVEGEVDSGSKVDDGGVVPAPWRVQTFSRLAVTVTASYANCLDRSG